MQEFENWSKTFYSDFSTNLQCMLVHLNKLFRNYFQFILIFIVVLPFKGVAQLHDQNWIIGSGEPYKNPIPGASGEGIMQFYFGPELSILLDSTIDNSCYTSFTCACISDKDGRLVAYTDGHNIFDNRHEIMLGGDTINPGNFWAGTLGGSYPLSDGAIFLPIPGKKSEYILLHKRIEFGKVEGRLPQYKCDRLYFSSFHYDDHLGRYVVSEKNNVLIEGEIAENEFAVAKHANGRDYWVVARRIGRPSYYFILVDSSGAHLHHEQQVGTAFIFDDLNGNMIFNREENMLARVIPEEGVELMEFDLCKGLFYNPSIQIFPDTFLINGNVAFSPNSRYLYVNSILHIYQYDISQRFNRRYKPILVGSWDSVLIEDTYSTLFFVGRLALDDKIYYTVFGTNGYYMHTMHRPDAYGKACDFRNHDFRLPNYMNGGLPFFPNFRNERLSESDCDSLSQASSMAAGHYYYNTLCRDQIRLSSSDPDKQYQLELRLYNMEGKLCYHRDFTLQEEINFNLAGVLPGIYILQLFEGGQLKNIDKIVVSY